MLAGGMRHGKPDSASICSTRLVTESSKLSSIRGASGSRQGELQIAKYVDIDFGGFHTRWSTRSCLRKLSSSPSHMTARPPAIGVRGKYSNVILRRGPELFAADAHARR